MGKVRDWLKTEEQRKLFDFIYNVPMDFALQQAGERWTEERVAEFLGIPQDRIPTLKKSLRRAFQRQLRLIHIER
jgi:cytochrome c2